jgi:tetratricopeptide (TPR) repeat protein
VGGNPDTYFWRGYRQYWERRYEDALESLEAAVALDGKDARSWCYKALAERALGQHREASMSARQARALRRQDSPGSGDVCAVLERVQGRERMFLNGELE